MPPAARNPKEGMMKETMMKALILLSLLGICALSIVVAAEPPDEEKLKEQKALAKGLVEAFAKENFKAARKDFDDVMTKALPTDRLESTWKTITGQVGAFKKVTGFRVESAAKFDFVYVVCQFEKIDV